MADDKNRPVPLHKRETNLGEPLPGENDPERVPDLDADLSNQNGPGNPPTKDLLDDTNSTTVNDNK